mmetsp:Transcript_39349/g.100891  ORF Transcript_39349/g.100891 Transcript_39349/m.100891 type:complete len:327 (-) Transcript_39349:447-1427(-)|eukprot:CAMPEP_0113912328 /NCGR_PEP_ID=MMETSP0780_2-20120614/28866_1 /TAXON_ID=652834 /ORGANISM="Palpitomonas bilix" /LENGTH=326 /DNA_ID=CAMNT_0000909275 /DNA_START=73 /DNA_END=1053 /DNA_ORIENTATION=+ /assembly_acc=CAM_ASM_000599
MSFPSTHVPVDNGGGMDPLGLAKGLVDKALDAAANLHGKVSRMPFYEKQVAPRLEAANEKWEALPHRRQQQIRFALPALFLTFVVLRAGRAHVSSSNLLYSLTVLAELFRVFGIMTLVAKLRKQKSCRDLSLESQILFTGVFLTRLLFKVFYEQSVWDSLIELFGLISTGYIVYMMIGPLNATYNKPKDSVKFYYIVGPAALLALVLHPPLTGSFFVNWIWAFSTYLECLSLLPQLLVTHSEKVVEALTSNYLLCLGMSRAIESMFWFISLYLLGYSVMMSEVGVYVMISEIIHTALLGDFMFLYVRAMTRAKSVSSMLSLPLSLN